MRNNRNKGSRVIGQKTPTSDLHTPPLKKEMYWGTRISLVLILSAFLSSMFIYLNRVEALNKVTNWSFTGSSTGWTASNGTGTDGCGLTTSTNQTAMATFAYDGANGNPAGSFQAVSGTANNTRYKGQINQQITLPGSGTVKVKGQFDYFGSATTWRASNSDGFIRLDLYNSTNSTYVANLGCVQLPGNNIPWTTLTGSEVNATGGTTYTVRLTIAYRNSGTNSATLRVDNIIVNAAPTGLSSPSQTSTSVDLSWTASTTPSGPNLYGYNVYYSTTSGGPYTKHNTAMVTGTTYTVTGLSAGTTYYFVITDVDVGKDGTGGNADDQESPYSAELTQATQAGVTTTVGNGTDPTNAIIAPGTTNQPLDAFTLQTSSGTDSVTSVRVTTANTTAVSTVYIKSDDGLSTYGSSSSPTVDNWDISVAGLTATTTLTQYKVYIDAKGHAALAAGTYAVTGTVTQITSTNTKNYNDTASATVTVDNSPPADATWGTITPGNTQIILNWTNPGDAVLILRNTSSITDAPTEGSSYTAGNTIGTSTVVYVGSGTTYTDTGLTNGQNYYYKIFAYDTYLNYAAGVQTGPHTPSAAPAAGTGMLLRRTSAGDDTCGSEGAACHDLKIHNSANLGTKYWSGSGGWGVTGGYGGKFVCQTCHTPHGTRNIYLIKETITTPGSGNKTVFLRKKGEAQGTSDPGYQATYDASRDAGYMADELGATDRYTDVCEVCHTQVTQHRNTNTASVNNHNNALDCTSCHDHRTGFKPSGESPGDQPCGTCHATQFNAMNTASAQNYHMYIQNADVSALSPEGGKYPQKYIYSAGEETDSHRRCLYCHADMNYFNPSVALPFLGRSYNLRKTARTAPASSSDITNTDFETTGDGGVCLSCHTEEQVKNTANRNANDNSTKTPRIPYSDTQGNQVAAFSSSSHSYIVQSRYDNSPGAGFSYFDAKCVKCHNDTLGTSYQDPTTGGSYDYTFSPHDSLYRHLLTKARLAAGTAVFTNASTGVTGTNTYWLETVSPGNKIRNVTNGAWYEVASVASNTSLTLATAYTGATTPSEAYQVVAETTKMALEEGFCFQCHSGGAAGNDLYGVQAMSVQAKSIKSVFGTSYSFRHPISDATGAGLHRSDEGINPTAGSWNPSTSRHVECNDCHNPHVAAPIGQDSGTASSGTVTSLTDTTKTWTANQWSGYSVKIVAGTGAGQTSVIYRNTSNTLTIRVATAPDATSKYIITNTGILNTGNNVSGANKGVWGIAPTWPAQPTPPTWNDYDPITVGNADPEPTDYNVYTAISTWNKTDNVSVQGRICIKCHSAFAYGASPPNTPSGLPTSIDYTTWDNTVGGAMLQGDKANEFNTNNLAHHAVFAKGNNQPITPTGQTAGTASYYNPNWPKYTQASGLFINTSGQADLTVGSLPATAIPGWFIYTGSISPAQGATTDWYQITAITSSTQFNVTPAPSAAVSNVAYFITAGLGNNFVPPWGPWSTVKCADCHTSDTTTDPLGPHGSATKWLLRKVDTSVTFDWLNAAGSIVQITPNTGADAYHFCLNCHRRDVYGDYGQSLAPTYKDLSRQPHPPDAGKWHSLNRRPKWGIVCMNCHGGARSGSMHGTNLGKGGGGTAGASYSGRRLLNGATWYAVTRGSTTALGQCWTKNIEDSVTTCGQNHGGVTFQAPTGYTGYATYDYNPGADP